MYTKFNSNGMGNARAALVYLFQELDSQGKKRELVQTMRGNPEMTTDLADSLHFKYRYTSGVIAWHDDDAPSEEQMQEVLDDFERLAFFGLEANQYSWYAVRHDNHIHVISARVELNSGKSLNIAPPGWEKTYEIFDAKHNTKNGWASAADLERRKVINTNDLVSIYSKLPKNKAKLEINKVVNRLVENGTLRTEKDVLAYFNKLGVAERRGKSISLKIEGFENNFRFSEKEGLAYARGFDAQKLTEELRAECARKDRETEADRAREHERVSELFETIISDRAEYARERYKRSEKSNDAEHKRDGETHAKKHEVEEVTASMDNSIHAHRDSDSVVLQPVPDNRGERGEQQERERVVESEVHHDTERRQINNIEEKIDDTVRKRIKSDTEATRRDVLERIKSARGSVSGRIEQNYRDIQERDTEDGEGRTRRTVASILGEVEQQAGTLAERIREHRITKGIEDGIRGLAEGVKSLVQRCGGYRQRLTNCKDAISECIAIKELKQKNKEAKDEGKLSTPKLGGMSR